MRILIGMSGGVDSTVAAKRLKEEGHEVEGAVLKMHEHTEIEEAQKAAYTLGIPIHVIDCTQSFDKEVKVYLVKEYVNSRTPNPCIVCNERVKFRVLCDFARSHGFDKIATGHYAAISEKQLGAETRYAVRLGDDLSKDQSYMLYRLSQDILKMLVFPLSKAQKSVVRLESKALNIALEDKAESQEICFLPEGDHPSFVESRAGKCPAGDFVDELGRPLGKHKGIIRYTVGQRKGLGIALGERMFVSAISARDNTVTLAKEPAKASFVTVDGLVFCGAVASMGEAEYRLRVKLRYLAKPVDCSVTVVDGELARVSLDAPATSVTPGQSAVFYDGDGDVLFGGFIREAY